MTLWPCREEILYYMGLLDFRVGPCYSAEQASQINQGLIQSQNENNYLLELNFMCSENGTHT